MTAARAYELGLVNEVVPAADLDAHVEQWVADILRSAPLSVRAIKQAAGAAATMPLEQAFATRFRWEERRMHSADAQEGPRAFVEKRGPQWRGADALPIISAERRTAPHRRPSRTPVTAVIADVRAPQPTRS